MTQPWDDPEFDWPSSWCWRLIEYWHSGDLDVCKIHSVWTNSKGEFVGFADKPEIPMGIDAYQLIQDLAAMARDIRLNPDPVVRIDLDTNQWRWLKGKDTSWHPLDGEEDGT